MAGTNRSSQEDDLDIGRSNDPDLNQSSDVFFTSQSSQHHLVENQLRRAKLPVKKGIRIISTVKLTELILL